MTCYAIPGGHICFTEAETVKRYPTGIVGASSAALAEPSPAPTTFPPRPRGATRGQRSGATSAAPSMATCSPAVVGVGMSIWFDPHIGLNSMGYFIEIRRIRNHAKLPATNPDAVNIYSVSVDRDGTLLGECTVEHRYGDGGLVLIAKALSAWTSNIHSPVQ